jgi:hypothetical protein
MSPSFRLSQPRRSVRNNRSLLAPTRVRSAKCLSLRGPQDEPRRDPLALGFGVYRLMAAKSGAVVNGELRSLEDVDQALSRPRRRLPGRISTPSWGP